MQQDVLVNFNKFRYNIGRKNIIKEANIEIKKGDKIVIQGKNGSGKTTLAKIICNSYYLKRRKNYCFTKDIFYISDKYYMPKFLNVRDFLLYFLSCYKIFIDIDYYINKLNIPNIKIKNLSKGNYKKVGILLGLLSSHELVIIDEIFDGLDKEITKVVIKLLKQSKKTLIIISHEREKCFNKIFKRYMYKEGVLSEVTEAI